MKGAADSCHRCMVQGAQRAVGRGTATSLRSRSPPPLNPAPSRPQHRTEPSLGVEPSRARGWRENRPPLSWLKAELLGGGQGHLPVNLAYLAEGFFKLQFLEYI